MTTEWQQARLPCGQPLATLVEVVTEHPGAPRDAHQRACRYCTAAMSDAERAWASVRMLAEQPVVMPEGLVASIMKKVRRLAEAGWVVLTAGARGFTKVSVTVLAALAAAAAGSTPGVRSVRYSWSDVVPGAAHRGGTDDRRGIPDAVEEAAAIELEVVTAYGHPIHDVAEAIRRNVRREIRERAAVETVRIDVDVRSVTR